MFKHILVLISILFIGIPFQTHAQTQVWTSNGANKIQQLSGGTASDLINSEAVTPWGIAVDANAGSIYWSNVTEGTIKRADLDGTNVQTLLTGLDLPRGIAHDTNTNIFYWAEAGISNPGIRSVDLDDDPLVTVDILTSGVESPYHITLDTQNQFIYWVDNATGQKNIKRVKFDGSGAETIISTIKQVAGVTLDITNNKLYWADFEDDIIYSADADALDQNIQTVYTTSGDTTPWALFYDSESESLYWSDYLNSTISEYDLNSSSNSELVNSVSTPSGFAIILISGSPSVVVEGNTGWRMMGVPVTGATFSDLTGINLVQGISGLPNSTFDPNIYIWNPTQSSTDYPDYNGSFVVPAGGSTAIEPGTGFIWYMYGPEAAADVAESKTFPLTVELTGNEASGDISLGALSADFHLIANPFISDIQFDKITDVNGDLLGVTGQVWDPNTGSEGSYVLTTSTALGNRLSAWQGAFIELGSSTEVIIPQSAKTTGASFLKRQDQPLAGQVEFQLDVHGPNDETLSTDKAAILYFHEYASTDRDGYDVSKLTPMSGSWATVQFAGSHDGEPDYKSQYSLPYSYTGTKVIPLTIQAENIKGDFTLSWPVVSQLPTAEILLADRYTGKTFDLTRPGQVNFRLDEANKVQTDQKSSLYINGSNLNAGGAEISSDRFEILINPEFIDEEVPNEIYLMQNYPNPFNPTTVISYELPLSANVRLEVFDMTGRQIATLISGQVSAGRHSATFDASGLSSGIYLYRLQTGNTIQTRKLTILK